MSVRPVLQEALNSALSGLNGASARVLTPLLEYDRAHDGDLVHTLHVYLQTGCNASRAAEQLFLHRSGLLYRLSRIEQLLAARLDDFEDRVALELAVLAVERGHEPSNRGLAVEEE